MYQKESKKEKEKEKDLLLVLIHQEFLIFLSKDIQSLNF